MCYLLLHKHSTMMEYQHCLQLVLGAFCYTGNLHIHTASPYAQLFNMLVMRYGIRQVLADNKATGDNITSLFS